jgi:hypothetical protein
MSGDGQLREGWIMDNPRGTTTTMRDPRPAPRAPLPLTPFTPTHDAIAKRAYELYEGSGRPDGRDVEFWLEAERELVTQR